MFNKKSILYKTLARALSLKRPHDTPNTEMFTDWLSEHVPYEYARQRHYDNAGNLHIDARDDSTNRTLFVAHVDTVHREEGANKFRKTQGTWYADGACLGADDGAGCAILMHLLHAHVPGYYIFTQGEEKGGIGAKFLADKNPELLQEFDRAIAFDRRGIDSVITHQGWGRCCSDEFAACLSDALCADGVLMYLGDDTGVYTDTAEFVDYIPECTNVSVGYENEHSDRETLDIYHFTALAAAVVNIKWDAMPTKRDPLEIDEKPLYMPSYAWKPKYSTTYTEDALDRLSTEWDGKWSDDVEGNFDGYTSLDRLEDALIDAKKGMYRDLLDLISETAYPEDPDMARKFMSRKLLTDAVLDLALEQCDAFDADTVLLSLFDTAYCDMTY